MVNFQKLFNACDPTRPLAREDRQYYIDFASVRGGRIIEELRRTITILAPHRPTCQLFSGHIGCGKSTELLRLKTELEQQGFHVVYFESAQDLDMADVDITDILLAIAHQVSKSLEAIQIRLRPPYFVRLFHEIAGILQTEIEITEVEFSVGIATITSATRQSARVRDQLRPRLEPRAVGIAEAINKELLEPAKEKLRRQGKAGLVVIVDNLEKLHNTVKPLGISQPEYLFINRNEDLKLLNCHVVYTIPLILAFSSNSVLLADLFGDTRVLPMVPVRLRDDSECKEGMALLQQMVLARAFPNSIAEVFDSPETLKRLCQVSGGHVRTLLRLIRSLIQKVEEEPFLSGNRLERVIRNHCNQLALGITDEQWNLLHQVAQKKALPKEGYQILVHRMLVFEYRYQDDLWFDINPSLAETKGFR